MGYEWPGWALDALNGIAPHEVQQALGAHRRRPVPASAHGIGVLTVWARTGTGRRLIVAVRRIDEDTWWILGARDMRPAEAAEFDRWEASER